MCWDSVYSKNIFWLLSVLHGPSFFHPSTLPLGYRGGGPWLGIEPGTSRTRSQHYTTRLSRRRYSVYVLGLKHTCYLLVTRWDEILADLAMFLYNQWRDIIIKQELVFLRVNTNYFFHLLNSIALITHCLICFIHPNNSANHSVMANISSINVWTRLKMDTSFHQCLDQA